jgi:hypothetical protein
MLLLSLPASSKESVRSICATSNPPHTRSNGPFFTRKRPHSATHTERYAVWASGNYRITFGWEGEDAINVDLEDYH